MNLLITQNSQNLQHSHSFSGSQAHNHAFTMPACTNNAGVGGNGRYWGTNPLVGYDNLATSQKYDNKQFCINATVTISGQTGNSGSSTEARPVDYTYKIWKRTA